VDNGYVNITRAYADSYLNGKIAGGLIGASSGNVRLTDIYTAGFVSFDSQGAGLVCGAANMTNCYTVLHKHGLPQTDLPYYAAAQSGTAENVYYDANTVGEPELTNTQAIGSMTIADMAQALGASFSTETTDSMAYNLMGQSLSTYVYPVLTDLTHYGDWAAAFQTGAFVYYEAYNNGTYGFYGANVDSTLNNNADVYVVGDGYGVVYQANDAALPDKAIVKIKDGNTEIVTEEVAVSSAVPYAVTDANGVQYQIYPLSKETVNTAAASANYYLKAELLPTGAGKTEYYYFNPHFAKTVLYLTDGNAEAPSLTKDSHIAVRTARHLYMMSLYYDKYAETTAKATFLQERNIDYAQYDWKQYSVRTDNTKQQQPIAGGSTAFRAVYDGGYHWITDVSFTTVDGLYVGFIGRNEGTIRNVVLRASYTEGGNANYYAGRSGDVEHNEVVYIGVLAGNNEANGRIENCAAGGYYLSGSDGTLHAYQNSNLYAGGLVGSNAGTIINSAADTPKMRLSSSYANVYMGGFAGTNSGIIRDSYALGHLETIFAKGGHVAMAGFAGENNAIIDDSYCATALTASGETAVTYGFAPAGGVVNNCRYLNNGTYSYIGQMYSFNFDNGAGDGISYRELQLSPDAPNAAKHSYDFNNTVTHTDQYPFPAVVRNASNELVHYGDWLDEEQMGTMGIFYWEHEVDGINNGYRFTYLGMHDGKHTGGTSLCNAHDDGGKIESYGYGYYELEEGTVSLDMEGADKSDQFNEAASEELKKQLHLTLDNGEEAEYTFYAYTVRTPAEAGGGDYLYLSGDKANSTWTLTYKPDGGNTETTYTYTVSPFFANAMSTKDAVTIKALDGTTKNYSAEPGSEENPYEVRSVQQLQYINWNHNAKTTAKLVEESNYKTFTYLHYAKFTDTRKINSKSDITDSVNRCWQQTQDANGTDFTGYTPIAGNYKSTTKD
ncbi:MAG: hypothetical protein IJN31_08545, partial [Peptococcaceae bacterium]|nr:hypothetical protein [Peptococcaceae bacterium]